jgi:hypothetical protein
MYAVITSVNNFGGLIGALLGGSFTHMLNITQTGIRFNLRFL